MRTLTRIAGAAVCTLAMQCAVSQADSLDCRIGSAAVHITAVSPMVFRLEVGLDVAQRPAIQSLFIDPTSHPGDVGKRVMNGGRQRLETQGGAIEVDPATGGICLRDGHGSVLMPLTTPFASDAADATKPSIDLRIGWPTGQPVGVYGCGNGEDSLRQDKVQPHLGNGIAVEPFFWAPAGFATLVVGENDDAPAQCDGHVDGGALTWAVPGKSVDLYLMIAPTLADASRELLDLSGRPPVPPRWTLGYMQSRWGWTDKAYIDDTLHQFQQRKLPVDAFVFDYEWFTATPDNRLKSNGGADYPDFGWNAKLFPNPSEQLQQLHDAGVHFVGIRKPRVGDSQTLADLRAKGWIPEGKLSSVNARALLFSQPAVRQWYAQHLEPLLHEGVDGWWNDEGERTYSNYLCWNLAERSAQDEVDPTRRFWSINRAFAPGLARLGAAAWTGDIESTWEALRQTPTAMLNWSVAGEPYVSCDIGGFGYRGEETPELLVRWMQAGTFFPIMRTHSYIKRTPHFPWLFGPDAEAAIRKTLDLRYQLIPALYSLCYRTAETGLPLMRPLLMQYPHDPNVGDLSSEWMLGSDLLAAPVLAAGGHRSIYLPDDIWYDFHSGQRVATTGKFDVDVPFDQAPLYVRGGAIVPLAPVVEHTRDLPGGALDVQVYAGRDGQFTLAEDDGSSTAYVGGNWRKTTFSWDDARRVLSWTRSGPYSGGDCFMSLRVTVHDSTVHFTLEQPLTATGSVSVPSI